MKPTCIESDSLHDITDYPDEYGEYWVIRYDWTKEEIESIEKLEFNPIDEEYPSQYDGWQDIQYEVENPTCLSHIQFYWAKEIKFK